MASRIELIVGLGNPGPAYERTRHNAGFWFVDAIAAECGTSLRDEAKFHGQAARVTVHGQQVWLLKPMNYMNRSGEAVAKLANFYKIPLQHILVAHDELDLPPGAVRLKQGGGHGGHNGLRDITARLSGNGFARLRIGIGHPGAKHLVTDYVLGKPPAAEREAIERAVAEAVGELPMILSGELQRAMNRLHSQA